ncbi:type I restriction enzyme HsdR N-terminal domain-containing protein [uncultured Treponema sp.]|uniref:type I restriction enzyme HsdR N-terminal domain-containing protein n=2 Tax=Treponema TaxID=157 RepID=UPI0025E7FA5C|nr:type I restriction enzyme HsdR N-terminal domain-containing protein [uncultured Treponema sp.]
MNKKLWELYKKSAEGQKLLDLFTLDENCSDNPFKKIEDLLNYLKCCNSDRIKYICCVVNTLRINAHLGNIKLPKINKSLTKTKLNNFFFNYSIKHCHPDDEKKQFVLDDTFFCTSDSYRDKAALMDCFSLFLFYFYTSSFFPILFSSRFDIIQKYCDALGCNMPDIPKSKDYKDYVDYYLQLNDAFHTFADDNNLNDEEFCACLYGFAPMMLEENKNQELPVPTNIWFTGGGAGGKDFEYLDNLGKGTSYNQDNIWACNEHTKRGDIIVMYCKSPRSYIHSIWRADSGGFFNPFDYYHCRSTICNGIKVPHVNIHDLKNDKYFSQVPIVRGNLQGLNGKELSAEDYENLMRLFREKDPNYKTEKLPKLFNSSNVNFGIIKIEKDVEENILIPFLKKIGYRETDWTRQLALKAGRNEKAIPDFVFFAKGEKHFENAPFVIEAKYDMSSVLEQQKAFSQCLSYARMLHSKLMGICDKERILIYKVSNLGEADRSNPIFENHWKSVYSDNIIGIKLKKIIGAEIVREIN